MIRAQERLISGVIAEYQRATVRAKIIKHYDIFAIMEGNNLLPETFEAYEITRFTDLGAVTQQVPIPLPKKSVDAVH